MSAWSVDVPPLEVVTDPATGAVWVCNMDDASSSMAGIPCLPVAKFESVDVAVDAIRMYRTLSAPLILAMREIVEILREQDYAPENDSNPYYAAIRLLKIRS